MVKSAKKVLGRARLRAAKIAKSRPMGVHSIGADPKIGLMSCPQYRPNELPALYPKTGVVPGSKPLARGSRARPQNITVGQNWVRNAHD